MSKESKFRVWDVRNSKYLEPSNVALLGNGKLLITEAGFYEFFTNTNEHDYIVERYTGCHDAYGKEIYDGDIIHHKTEFVDPYVGYVTFAAGIFFLNYQDGQDEEIGYILVSNLKVVGNILENPDMLK